ncbi:hypothetical protein N9Y17_02655 [Gammaproteobacteria bacterium]|nr:hypothetical protein [Gammaproteobacteria bacterium]
MICLKQLGGMLLIAGTAIGAGMLALPITVGATGPLASIIILFACFLFMLATLFLSLEAHLCTKKSNHIISMSKYWLGTTGASITWISFLFLLYAASSAYLNGAGNLIATVTDQISWLHLSTKQATLIFAGLFSWAALLGTQWVDKINRWLMVGLVLSYIALLFLLCPESVPHDFFTFRPHYIYSAIPVVILSFTSHIMLPSLIQYYDHDIRIIKRVLIYGSMIPLVFYLIWQVMLLSCLPQHGPNSIINIIQCQNPLACLNHALYEHQNQLSGISNTCFSLFALATSFLGVLLSLTDFLTDGLKSSTKAPRSRWKIILIALLPSLIFSIFYPNLFVSALGFAGVCVAILYGLIPVAIVWKARYYKPITNPSFRLPGGKTLLLIILLTAIFIISIQLLVTLDLFIK